MKPNPYDQWLSRRRNENHGSSAVISNSPLSEGSGWEVAPNDPHHIRRKDRGFFQIVAAVISACKAGREVAQWEQPLLVETGRGVVVLFVREVSGRVEALVQTKWEPGNPEENGKNGILLSPSVQASESNLEQAHGGKAPPLVEYIDKDRLISLPCDGARFLNKENLHGTLFLKEGETLEPPTDDYKWVPINWLHGKNIQGEVNEHLMKLIGLTTSQFCYNHEDTD